MAEPTRYELVKVAYDEVLDATKHQDDKIGRILAAVAFFTGGVIAFLDRDALPVRYAFGDRNVPLVAISLGIFLVLSALSALLFVLATSSTLTLPRRELDPPRQRRSSSEATSHLFFQVIADIDPALWKDSWNPPARGTLAELLEEELIVETHNLARRASNKHRRSQEASALLLIAMPFFAITVLLALDGLTNPPTTGGMIEWTFTRRLLVGGALSLFAALYVFFAGAQSRRKLGTLLFALPAFVVLTVAGDGEHPIWAVGVVAAGAVTVPQLLKLTSRSLTKPKRSISRRGSMLAAACVVLVAYAAYTTTTDERLHQLLIGVGVISGLPVGSFTPGVRRVFEGR